MAEFDKVQDHGGKREYSETGGEREAATGKGRFDLIPPYALTRVAKHYEAGSRKYTTDITIPIDQFQTKLVMWCTCGHHNATQKNRTTHVISADPATKSSSGQGTQSTQSGSEKTAEAGRKTTSNASEQVIDNTKPHREVSSVRLSMQEHASCVPSVSPQTTKEGSSTPKEVGVASADPNPIGRTSTSTTTTPPAVYVDFYAVNATKALDFSEILSKVLSEHSPTCAIRQLQITLQGETVRIVKSGDRNWEKGLPLHRFIESAYRHLNQFMDSERSEDHLAAIIWNIAGYMHTERAIRRGRLPRSLMDVPWPFSIPVEDE